MCAWFSWRIRSARTSLIPSRRKSGSARTKSRSGGLVAISSSGRISSEWPNDRSVVRRPGAHDPRDVPQLRQVEVEPAVERLHNRAELGFRGHQATKEPALAVIEQVDVDAERLGRELIRQYFHEVRSRPLDLGKVPIADCGLRIASGIGD